MARSAIGCITDLGGGRWRVRVSGGHDPHTGKRIRLSKVVRGTKKDALAVQTRLLVEVGSAEAVRGTVTFGEFVESFFLPYKLSQIDRGEFRPNSYERLRSNLKKNAAPLWGTPLCDVSTYQIEACLAAVAGPTARFNTFADIKNVWNRAVSWGFLSKMNATLDNVTPPRKAAPEIETADPFLLADILDMVCGHAIEPIVLLMSGCGLRCSEACARNWEDFDWDEGLVDVTSGFHKIKGAEHTLPTKTPTSNARVSVPKGVLKRLRAICFSEPGKPKRGAVAKMANGRRYHPHYVSDVYRGLYRKMLPDSPYVCVKNLRHSHATILLESGEDIALVSKRLRHADLSTTYRKYTKPGMAADRHSSEMFDSALEAGKAKSQRVPNT